MKDQQTAFTCFVGVDVAKAKLDICWKNNQTTEIKNTKGGIVKVSLNDLMSLAQHWS